MKTRKPRPKISRSTISAVRGLKRDYIKGIIRPGYIVNCRVP